MVVFTLSGAAQYGTRAGVDVGICSVSKQQFRSPRHDVTVWGPLAAATACPDLFFSKRKPNGKPLAYNNLVLPLSDRLQL